jgi:hypothetical protein
VCSSDLFNYAGSPVDESYTVAGEYWVCGSPWINADAYTFYYKNDVRNYANNSSISFYPKTCTLDSNCSISSNTFAYSNTDCTTACGNSPSVTLYSNTFPLMTNDIVYSNNSGSSASVGYYVKDGVCYTVTQTTLPTAILKGITASSLIYASVTSISNCPSPTPSVTPTRTPTPTPTLTPSLSIAASSFSYNMTAFGEADGATACANFAADREVYAATANIATVTRFFEEAGLINGINGGDEFYAYERTTVPGVLRRAIISGTGNVSSAAPC